MRPWYIFGLASQTIFRLLTMFKLSEVFGQLLVLIAAAAIGKTEGVREIVHCMKESLFLGKGRSLTYSTWEACTSDDWIDLRRIGPLTTVPESTLLALRLCLANTDD